VKEGVLMSNLKINEDIQVGETNIKFSELISTIQNFNTSKLVFSGAHVGQNISANTFSLGSFNISPSVIDTKFLSINSSGILTVEKEGFYRIE
jgi:DNA topoisomerase VI subunit A